MTPRGVWDAALGWVIGGLFFAVLIGGVVVLVLALPVVAVVFPITLSALALMLGIGWWRHRRGR